MPNDLSTSGLTVNVHPANAIGAPISSGVSILLATTLQGLTGGFTVPTDTAGWITLAINAAIALLGLFVKIGQK